MVFGRRQAQRRFVEAAARLRARYALTLFSGARRRAPFVRASVTHSYFEGNTSRVAAEIGARPISEGGNPVLVEPDGDAVFLALQEAEGARVVSNARLYVDLFNFEARGREQADFLLETVMPDLRTQDSPAAQALQSDDPVERRTYAEKERNHHTIITSPYAESRQEVEQRAAEIHKAVRGDEAGR